MQHTFRARKSGSTGRRGRGGSGGSGGSGREKQPNIDTSVDLENLPEVDFNHFDAMSPADLAKAAKKAKISLDVDKGVVIESLLKEANPDAVYRTGILELMNDGWGFLRRPTFGSSNDDVYVSQNLVRKNGLKEGWRHRDGPHPPAARRREVRRDAPH